MTDIKEASENAPKQKRRGYQSLFFKLFAVLMGAVLLTYLAFGGFYRSFFNFNNRIESNKNNLHYSDLLSREIGSPPDTILAAQLSKDLGRAIGIRGNGMTWHSHGFSSYAWDHQPDSVNILLHEGRIWTGVSNGGYVYTYGSRRRPFSEGLNRDWITLLLVLSLAWVIAWGILHSMLRPLKVLEEGVTAVRSGNLDVTLPEKGKDELGELARSFNAMTQSLRERIQARDQLLLDVSHELRSPLTRMRVALEMAIPGTAVDSLKEEVEDLEKMVSELLETERLKSDRGALKLEPTDLNAIVRKKIVHFEGRSPGIVTNFEDLPPVLVDPVRLRLVLRNILENAFKYGKNAVRPIEFSMRKEGNLIIFEVRDHGPGISEKDLKFVFEPFYRVDRARSRATGYGLGLGLCKRIVELHGGNIFIASAVGEGTRVAVEIPIR